MCDVFHGLPTSLGEPSNRTLSSFPKSAKQKAFFTTTAGTGFHGHPGRTSEAKQASMKQSNQGSLGDAYKNAPIQKDTAYSSTFTGGVSWDLGSNHALAELSKEAVKGGKMIPARSWKSTSYSDSFLDPDSCQDPTKPCVWEKRAPGGICDGPLHEVKSWSKAQYASPPAFAYKPPKVFRPVNNLSTPKDVVSSFDTHYTAMAAYYRSPKKSPKKMHRSTSSPTVTRPPSELSPSQVHTSRACSSVVARPPSGSGVSPMRLPSGSELSPARPFSGSGISPARPASVADRLSHTSPDPWCSSSYQKSFNDPATVVPASRIPEVHGALSLLRRRLQTS